jgi:hypothetical protein
LATTGKRGSRKPWVELKLRPKPAIEVRKKQTANDSSLGVILGGKTAAPVLSGVIEMRGFLDHDVGELNLAPVPWLLNRIPSVFFLGS